MKNKKKRSVETIDLDELYQDCSDYWSPSGKQRVEYRICLCLSVHNNLSSALPTHLGIHVQITGSKIFFVITYLLLEGFI
jgi:hypothetical protein